MNRLILLFALLMLSGILAGCSQPKQEAPADVLAVQIKSVETNSSMPRAAKDRAIADLRAKASAQPTP